MMQVVEQTHAQKIEMFMKLPKRQIIEMLIECNRIINNRTLEILYSDNIVNLNMAANGNSK